MNINEAAQTLSCGEVCSTSAVNIFKTDRDNFMRFSLFSFSQQRAFIYITNNDLLI